jgi:hypothetical protein
MRERSGELMMKQWFLVRISCFDSKLNKVKQRSVKISRSGTDPVLEIGNWAKSSTFDFLL